MKGGVGMSNGKIKSRFLTNPYLFSLNLLAVIVVSVPYLYFIPQIIRSCEDWRVPTVLIGFYLPCILLGFFNAYNYYGWITFYADHLVLRAPLRKPIHMRYDKIAYIQIDYNTLSVSRQFWVILGRKPMPSQYVHRVHRMPFSENLIRVQFSRQLDQSLRHYLSGAQNKCYCRAHAALRVYQQKA